MDTTCSSDKVSAGSKTISTNFFQIGLKTDYSRAAAVIKAWFEYCASKEKLLMDIDKSVILKPADTSEEKRVTEMNEWMQ